jgi:type II secretory pathway pseudopilin PulG
MVNKIVYRNDVIPAQAGIQGVCSIRAAGGFTYIGLLFAIVLLGILLSTAGVLWDTQARREKEQQLLFVGAQYQQAIISYHAVIVNGVQQFPPTIDELLLDRRFPMPVRHLRKRYIDPVTNSSEWGLLRDGTGIIALYSLSSEVPIKRADFGPWCDGFGSAKSYSDWKFAFH